MLNYSDKTFSCLDDKGNTIVVKGIPKKGTIREISALKWKDQFVRDTKFAVYIIDNIDKNNLLKIENIPILKEFKDIFLKEILRLPSKRNIDFTINLVLGKVPTSKDPYWMNIVYFTKLKSQIQEWMD